MFVVLLAHADTNECDWLTRTLEKAGHIVCSYTNANDAWDAVTAQSDFLVLNVGLPKGQPHGLAIASRARLVRPAAKVIFLSRLSDPANNHLSDECVLQQPFDLATLLALVEDQLAAT